LLKRAGVEMSVFYRESAQNDKSGSVEGGSSSKNRIEKSDSNKISFTVPYRPLF